MGTQMGSVDYEKIGQMIGIAVSSAIAQTMPKLIESIKVPLLEQPKQDYYSLVAYCNLNKIESKYSQLAMIGRDLRNMAKEKGMVLRKMPDERWGSVNSYPVELLDEYFSV